MSPLDRANRTRRRTLQGCLEEYSSVLQGGCVQLAWKIDAEIDRTGAAGGYLTVARTMHMDEWEGTENYVGFAGCCHALLDRESASKVDFLSVQCVASMMTHVGFASRMVDEILKNKPMEKSHPLTKRTCQECQILAAGYACTCVEVNRICNL